MTLTNPREGKSLCIPTASQPLLVGPPRVISHHGTLIKDLIEPQTLIILTRNPSFHFHHWLQVQDWTTRHILSCSACNPQPQLQ